MVTHKVCFKLRASPIFHKHDDFTVMCKFSASFHRTSIVFKCVTHCTPDLNWHPTTHSNKSTLAMKTSTQPNSQSLCPSRWQAGWRTRVWGA
jgi:hypothetical protein